MLLFFKHFLRPTLAIMAPPKTARKCIEQIHKAPHRLSVKQAMYQGKASQKNILTIFQKIDDATNTLLQVYHVYKVVSRMTLHPVCELFPKDVSMVVGVDFIIPSP